VLPGGSRYWFEKVGSEDLEVLQIVCKENRAAETGRINLDQHKEWMTGDHLKVYENAEQDTSHFRYNDAAEIAQYLSGQSVTGL
jgi:hypothetical protein